MCAELYEITERGIPEMWWIENWKKEFFW